jgi:hypothetical protein
MCSLVAALQVHHQGRDWLDNFENFVAAKQRRGRQGVREAEVGNSPGAIGKGQISSLKRLLEYEKLLWL